MSRPSGAEQAQAGTAEVQASFLEMLPRIRTHAQIYFRHLRCPGKREDACLTTIIIPSRRRQEIPQ
jgi:hypothetical protein